MFRVSFLNRGVRYPHSFFFISFRGILARKWRPKSFVFVHQAWWKSYVVYGFHFMKGTYVTCHPFLGKKLCEVFIHGVKFVTTSRTRNDRLRKISPLKYTFKIPTGLRLNRENKKWVSKTFVTGVLQRFIIVRYRSSLKEQMSPEKFHFWKIIGTYFIMENGFELWTDFGKF